MIQSDNRAKTIQEILTQAICELSPNMAWTYNVASQGGVLSTALNSTLDYSLIRLQAELLLAHALHTTRTNVLAHLNDLVNPDVQVHYGAVVTRRAQHEPLAYILGHSEFCELDFLVDQRVLIPRHETEILVRLALERARNRTQSEPVIIDVGTGSGVLALTLAYSLRRAHVYASDISPDAIAVAQINATQLGLQAHVKFLQGDLLDPINVPFNILVGNLPYIPATRYALLPQEIREYEPRVALDGGNDGLDVIRRLLLQLELHTAGDAFALLEISEEQGSSIIELIKQVLPHAQMTLHKDYEGLDRVVEINNICIMR